MEEEEEEEEEEPGSSQGSTLHLPSQKEEEEREGEEDKDLEMMDSDGEADEIEEPWWYHHLGLPCQMQECVYCRADFVVGNCGVEYEGRGHCYECMALRRAEKATVWLHIGG